MSDTESIFAGALRKTRFSEKQESEWKSTTLRDLKFSIISIQTRLESTKDNQNMNRLRRFLTAMEQLGKGIEIFTSNSANYLAFVWGPMKFILHVSTRNSYYVQLCAVQLCNRCTFGRALTKGIRLQVTCLTR